MEDTFNELNTDPLFGTQLMHLLGVSRENLDDPSVFHKFNAIIKYFSTFPEETRDSLLRRITLGKQDKLNMVWEYAELSKQHLSLQKELSEKTALKEKLDLAGEEHTLQEEIDTLYERSIALQADIRLYDMGIS